jgi:hypothetical protein
MHKTPHKLDKEATKAMGFASRYSYISRRLHPGTDHPCQYLAGMDDIGRIRLQVFERDGWQCVDCQKYIVWEVGHPNSGHMAHGGNTKISRCDCPENLKTKCYDCHMLKEHNREVKFGEAWYR